MCSTACASFLPNTGCTCPTWPPWLQCSWICFLAAKCPSFSFAFAPVLLVPVAPTQPIITLKFNRKYSGNRKKDTDVSGPIPQVCFFFHAPVYFESLLRVVKPDMCTGRPCYHITKPQQKDCIWIQILILFAHHQTEHNPDCSANDWWGCGKFCTLDWCSQLGYVTFEFALQITFGA